MNIKYPEDLEKLYSLKAGEVVNLTSTIYTARDAAHLRLKQMVEKNEKLPIDFNNQIIYYAGPTPTKPGKIVGSIGPTTSSRMDPYGPLMKKLNVKATIGKGPRSKECTRFYIENKILYFVATGGCGALLSHQVTSAKEIAFFDLGPESIKKLEVVDFPIILAIDAFGNNIFDE